MTAPPRAQGLSRSHDHNPPLFGAASPGPWRGRGWVPAAATTTFRRPMAHSTARTKAGRWWSRAHSHSCCGQGSGAARGGGAEPKNRSSVLRCVPTAKPPQPQDSAGRGPGRKMHAAAPASLTGARARPSGETPSVASVVLIICPMLLCDNNSLSEGYGFQPHATPSSPRVPTRWPERGVRGPGRRSTAGGTRGKAGSWPACSRPPAAWSSRPPP